MADALYDRILGALIGAAAGDGMGAATEGRSTQQIRDYFGHTVTDFEVTPNDTFGKGNVPGQATDDFSSAYFLAKSIVASGGTVDQKAVEAALIDWSEHPQFFDRFAGPTTRAAIRRMKGETTEKASGVRLAARQATNGSAMRISPIGMLHPGDLEGTIRDAVQVTVLTHDNDLALSGACAVACAVSQALMPQSDPLSILHAALYGAEEGERWGRLHSQPAAGPSVVSRLRRAIAIGLGEGTPGEKMRRISDEIGCGLHVSEAVPAAIGLFAAAPLDPMQVLTLAVNVGYDTDTIATMAGAIAGAFRGAGAFPTHFLPTLDKANGLPLEPMAHALTDIAKKRIHLPDMALPGRREKVLGCVIGAAAGDALGAPTERRSTRQIAQQFGGPVTGYETPPEGCPAYGRARGQVTDAFSISYLLGRHLQAAGGRADRRIAWEALREWGQTEWFQPFAGMTTRKVVDRLNQEEKMSMWAYSGILGSKLFKGHYYALSSNGAAVKAYIPALYHPGDMDGAVRDAVELTMASHDDPFSISGACAVSAAVARALAPECTLYDMLQAALYGAEKGERLAREQKDIWDYPGPSVAKRLRMALEIAANDPENAPEKLRDLVGCGPAVAETVPTAFGLLAARDGDTRKAMVDAVNIGDETAAIASLVGQLGGALRGGGQFPAEETAFLSEANGLDLVRFAEGFLN